MTSQPLYRYVLACITALLLIGLPGANLQFQDIRTSELSNIEIHNQAELIEVSPLLSGIEFGVARDSTQEVEYYSIHHLPFLDAQVMISRGKLALLYFPQRNVLYLMDHSLHLGGYKLRSSNGW